MPSITRGVAGRRRVSSFCGGMAWAAAALAFAPASVAQDGCVPRDLVVGLLGGFEGPGSAFFIGAPEPEVLNGIPLPAGALVVGGTAHDGRVTLITTLTRESSQVRGEMTNLLSSGGWKIREENQMQGGFQAAQRQQQVMYCSPDQAMLYFSTGDRSEGGTLLRVSRIPKMPFRGPCSEGDAGRPRGMESPMPDLEPPAGVNSTFHGQSSLGMGRGRSVAVALLTRDSPRDIAGHFNPQLADQGWILDSDLVGDSMASQMWSRTDAEGKTWRGILFVAVLGEDTRDVSFSVLPRD